MKNFLLACCLCSFFSVFAQIKVYPLNKVLIGPIWWENNNYPGNYIEGSIAKSHVLYINGSTEFAPYPAQSSIRIMNYPNGLTFNDPAIIPQWQNSAWLGTPDKQFWKIYSKEFYCQ